MIDRRSVTALATVGFLSAVAGCFSRSGDETPASSDSDDEGATATNGDDETDESTYSDVRRDAAETFETWRDHRFELTVDDRRGDERVYHHLEGRFSVAQPDGDAAYERRIDGDRVRDRTYEFTAGDGTLFLRVGEDSVELEDVTEADLGRTFEIELADRTEWTYESVRNELEELLRAEVEDIVVRDRGSRGDETLATIYELALDPSDDLIARYLTKTVQQTIGTDPVEIDAGDLRDATTDVEFRFGVDPETGDVTFVDPALRIDTDAAAMTIEYVLRPELTDH
ncbi:hypothetical protein [Halopiger goleimassiliensis]|uniref:hypothetical protein n=1 Tax=Halopiger goleimassiliensis TaxID=1293048 RepID=UPI000677DFB6|nr:hypothetical protein [Halopiger goleimassiliensis]